MNWLKQVFSRRRLYSDLSGEMQQHLDEKVEELIATGMPRKEATAAARREFGNVALMEEDSRDVWRWLSAREFFRGCSLRVANAPAQSLVHRRGVIDDRDWNRRQHRGLQRCEQRAAETAALSQFGRTGVAAPDRSGRGRTSGFRKRSAAVAFDVFHVCRTQPRHFSRWGFGTRERRASRAWPSRSRCASWASATAYCRRWMFRRKLVDGSPRRIRCRTGQHG